MKIQAIQKGLSFAICTLPDGYSCVTFLKENYPFVKFTVPYLSGVFLDGEENEYLTQGKERLKLLKSKFKEECQQHFNVICPASSYQYFKKELCEFPNTDVYLVRNELYGGSVTIAGLLNHEDILNQYNPTIKNATTVLPFEMYDLEKNDITGRHISELESFYNSKIWTA